MRIIKTDTINSHELHMNILEREDTIKMIHMSPADYDKIKEKGFNTFYNVDPEYTGRPEEKSYPHPIHKDKKVIRFDVDSKGDVYLNKTEAEELITSLTELLKEL